MKQRYMNRGRSGFVSRCLLALVFMALTGCGFHLRGHYKLPATMAKTFITAANQNSELVRSLKRSLQANDIQIVDSSQTASATLKIGAEKQDKRVLSVDSRGRAREYELSYAVTFSLQSHDSDLVVEDQTLVLEREFLFDTEDVLGKGREEATLLKDMQQDMVRLILLRLQAVQQ